jgi:hypothetical protein
MCPRCGKQGFLARRWVRSSRYPKYSSFEIYEVEMKKEELAKNPDNKEIQSWLNQFGKGISGNKYWGEIRPKPGPDDRKGQDFYRVVTGKYHYDYFGHYDKEKYRQQMVEYKNGRRKSRPNGRKWCKVSVGGSDRRKSWF